MLIVLGPPQPTRTGSTVAATSIPNPVSNIDPTDLVRATLRECEQRRRPESWRHLARFSVICRTALTTSPLLTIVFAPTELTAICSRHRMVQLYGHSLHEGHGE